MLPSALMTVTSYPLPLKSVVTAPAVPVPTALTAAAWALVAASQVTAFSAFFASRRAVGRERRAAVELQPPVGDELPVVVVVVAAECEVAAFPIAAPPAAIAATPTAPAIIRFRGVDIVSILSVSGFLLTSDAALRNCQGSWKPVGRC